jgi:uncharacterized protein YodC (DUF2158 family)
MFTRFVISILIIVITVALFLRYDEWFTMIVAAVIFFLQIVMFISDEARNKSYKRLGYELKNTKQDLERAEEYRERRDNMLKEARAEVQKLQQDAHPNPFKVGDPVRHVSSERKMVVSMICDYPNVFCEWMDEGEKKQTCVFDFRTLKKTTRF